MPIEICTISGFTKTAGNSTAIKVDDDVVLLDMGLAMENYIRYQDDREDVRSSMTYKQLRQANALPNYSSIDGWNVLAIAPSHGHLDHVGAVPYASLLFPKAPVVSTPYTIEVLRTILKDDRITIPNKLVPVNLNSTFKVSDKITLEFVNVTHSIPHSSLIVVHTPYGKVVYANDYKFDRQPTLGQKPNFTRLQKLGEEGVSCLIIECLYANEHRKMPSESVAKQMLKDVMLGINCETKGMLVTTFSSHIARLKSIIEMGKKLDRKIVFFGRSLSKYVKAAERLKIVDFSQSIQIVSHRDKVEKMFNKIMKEGKEKYLIVCTGHQGEPKAVLSRLMRKQFPYRFSSGDVVIFSCSVIPVELNKDNRDVLERGLKNSDVRIFRDVHVSGHGGREDHRDLIELLKPKNIIPSHAGGEKAEAMVTLGKQLGYKKVHVMKDGQILKL